MNYKHLLQKKEAPNLIIHNSKSLTIICPLYVSELKVRINLYSSGQIAT